MSTITAEQIVELFDDDSDELETVKEGDWISEYKDRESRSDIVKHVPTGTHWRIDLGRDGSYYTDFEYDDTEATQVEPVEKIVKKIVWKAVQ